METKLATARAAYKMRGYSKAAAEAAAPNDAPANPGQPPPPPPAPDAATKAEEELFDDDEEDEKEDADEGKGKDEDSGEKPDVQVWEWLDDLLEGAAFLYTVSVHTMHSFSECVRRTAYPIKEEVLNAYDGVGQAWHGGSGLQRRVRGHNGVQTFAHDDLD